MANLFTWLGGLFGRLTGKVGRVLLIDPNPDSVALLRTHLKDMRIRMERVDSPGAAFSHIHRHAGDPAHLFIIANRQPGNTSGVETARLIGQIRNVSRAPVIIVHDRMAEEHLMALKNILPRAEFVERPYSGKRMRDLVKTLVKRGQHRPAARTSLGNTHSMPPPPRIRSKHN